MTTFISQDKRSTYRLALLDGHRNLLDAHRATQVLPLLQLGDVGVVAIERAEEGGLALDPSLVLELVTPLALFGETFEVGL
jgi:hypothetical protein